MSKRRMFSLQIVDTDAFLEMPMSSQLLYFHLSMRADDEGFVGNPRRIVKMVGSNDDDFKVLIAKRFILAFESGVVVIKHWLIHNTIRMDRFSSTKYEDEKGLLRLKSNMSYTDNPDEPKLLEPIKKEKPNWLSNRQEVMNKSDLPYSFSYKIKHAFVGRKCPICNIEMGVQLMAKNCIPTIQHNIPLSQGGKHELGNISVICHNCNVSIQDKITGELNSKEVIDVWHTIANQSATQVKLSKVKLSKHNITNTIEYLKAIPEDDIKNLMVKYRVEKRCILSRAEDVIDYCEAKGKKYSNYLAALRNFLKSHIQKHPDCVIPIKTPEPEYMKEKPISEEQRQKSIKKLEDMKKSFLSGTKI